MTDLVVGGLDRLHERIAGRFGRLDGLVHIGVDEVSWKKHHNYLTLVTNHTSGRIVWGKAGKDTAT